MSIYKKILEIQKELKIIKKDGSAQGYKYTTADQLFCIIRPKMDEVGLLLFQELIESKSEHVLWKTKYGEKQQTFNSSSFKFTWVDVDTGETISHQFKADGLNDWDKAIGSAMTYAERYYVMKQFHIPTSELDPDARKEKEENHMQSKVELANDTQLEQIRKLATQKGSSISSIIKHYKVASLPKMTFANAKDCIEQLKTRKDI